MDNYNKEPENKLPEMIRQKEQADKLLLAMEWVIGALSVVVLLIPAVIGACLPMEEWQRGVIVLSGFIPSFVGFFFALKIEQIAGYYMCRECGHKHVPTYKAVLLAPHMGRTRHMKCPGCCKKTWQKKVLNKD